MSLTVSRKEFLALGASGAGLAALSGCSFLSTNPDSQGGDANTTKGQEAPMLAAQVEAGSLPAVTERLPTNPKKVQPLEQAGVYGGTIQTVLASTDPSWIFMTVTHDHLVTWNPDYSQKVENVAEKFEVLEDGKVYVFYLREGTKWSDGKPFTSADLMWWYDNVLLNKAITPLVPSALRVGDKPVVVTTQGDYQVTFTFPAPNALFLDRISQHSPDFWLLPQHYLEPFHKNFNDALPANWAQDFLTKIDPVENVDLPRLSAWVPKNPHGDGGRQVWERNPYYWKVDADGSQLPYVDTVAFRFFTDPGPLLLAAANGDVDIYQRAEITVPKNRPVLSDGQEKGGYTLINVKDPNHNTIGICLNLNHKNPDKKKMYQNKDFRIGLSHAIDRQQIIDLVYQRQGKPWQTAPRPEVPFYTSDDFGTQYTEFNLDKAKQSLAKAGYGETNGNGKLLGEDGKPIVISVLCQARYPDMIDAMEFVKGTWVKVGIELRIDTASPELVGERMDALEYDCTLDKGEVGYLDLVADPRWLFATGGSSYAPLWSNWYEGGSPSEKPPQTMQRQMALYREKVRGSADQDTQYAALKEIIEIARDQFWSMGVSLPGEPFCIKSNRLHNVPGENQMWLSFKAPYPAVANMTTFYLQPK